MKLTLWGPALVAGVLGATAIAGGALVFADEADLPGPISLRDNSPQASEAAISRDEAISIATVAAEGNLGEIELDRENGVLAWEVEVGNADVLVDANTGAVIRVERDDDGFDDTPALPDGALTATEAVAIAQGAASGNVDSVEVERWLDSVVYIVEVGNMDVVVDAVSGEVLAAERDD